MVGWSGQGGDWGLCTDNALLFYCLMTHHLGYWYCLSFFFFLGGEGVVEILLIFENNFWDLLQGLGCFQSKQDCIHSEGPTPPPTVFSVPKRNKKLEV